MDSDRQLDEPILAARRELHELTVLSSALLRLATKVQSRCDELRRTLGDVAPVGEEEVDVHAPRPQEIAAADGGASGQHDEEDDPAALLAMSLASEGMSRAEIGDYLRRSFGMQDTDALLDRVLPEQI